MILVDFSALWVVVGTLLAVAVFLLILGLRALRMPVQTGIETMVGETGVVKRVSAFRRRLVVEVRGEFWWAKLRFPVKPVRGMEVVVKDVDTEDLVLLVEPIKGG